MLGLGNLTKSMGLDSLGPGMMDKMLKSAAPQIDSELKNLLDSVIVADGERAVLFAFTDKDKVYISLAIMNNRMQITDNLHTGVVSQIMSIDGMKNITQKLQKDGKIRIQKED
jgi:hypothetical protein